MNLNNFTIKATEAIQQAQQMEAQAVQAQLMQRNPNMLPAPQVPVQSITQPQMAQPSEQTAPQVQGVM